MAVDDPYMLPYLVEIFTSEGLAQAHVADLKVKNPYTTYLVEDWEVLDALPTDDADSTSSFTEE